MDNVEQQFREAMRSEREGRGVSQESLAASLRERGFPKVRQATIWEIEASKRKIGLGEAVAIAHVLGFVIPGVSVSDEVIDLRNRIERSKLILDGLEG